MLMKALGLWATQESLSEVIGMKIEISTIKIVVMMATQLSVNLSISLELKTKEVGSLHLGLSKCNRDFNPTH